MTSTQVNIITPLSSYLADPAVHAHRHLRRDVEVSAVDVTRVAGIARGTLQQRLQRAAAGSVRQMTARGKASVYLNLLHTPTMPKSDPSEQPAPVCRELRCNFALRHVEAVLRALAQGRSPAFVAAMTSISLADVARIIDVRERFSALTGIEVGAAAALRPPRLVAAAKPIWASLDNGDLEVLAGKWALVAGRVPLSSGWAHLDSDGLAATRAFLGNIGLDAEEMQAGRLTIVQKFRMKSDGSTPIAIWQTLAWVLTAAWIFTELRT